MSTQVTREWQDRFVLTREFSTPGARAAFFASVRRGEFVAVLRGAYMAAEAWAAMGGDEQYRTIVLAAAELLPGKPVFSHYSAAALWRLPMVGAWQRRVHVTVPTADGGRSSGVVFRHTVGVPDDLTSIDGLTVTSLGRTVVDLARAASFGQAVVFADAALHRSAHPIGGIPGTSLDRADLYGELAGVPIRQGTAKIREIIEFADGTADRPGESLSRVSMLRAGITMPLLQAPLRGASGRQYFVDFWWPTFNVIGEFDGHDKYRLPEFLRGRTPEQAVYDEKLREDDLRAAGHGVSRWPWAVAVSPRRLAAHLAIAGVR
ncbi:hypothetical protein [Parafrigoribacterium humi]|uniref:hypothetical protein n=1 Tax=Parafrigoribacterium humi TaxID=3144664 RepID=UPI0032EE0FD8